MAKFKIAMLSYAQQEDLSNGDELTVDSSVLDIKNMDDQINSENVVVDEANDSIGTMNAIADKLDTQQRLPVETVQLAQEMMVYFTKRSGLTFSGVNAAMESDLPTPNKKQNIVKELRAASESFEDRVAIAQEGIIDKIKHKFSLMFATYEKLEKELKAVSSKYDQGEVKTDVIKSPAFAGVLAVKSKDTIDASDIIEFASKADKVLNGTEFIRQINDMSSTVDRLTMALTKGGVFGSDKGIGEIEDIQQTVIDMNQKIHQEFDVEKRSGKVDVVPIDRADKEKLVPIIFSLLDVREFEKAEENLARAAGGFIQAYANAAQNRLVGEWAKDMRSAKQVSIIIQSSYNKMNEMVTRSFYIAHACVKYIKASTK